MQSVSSCQMDRVQVEPPSWAMQLVTNDCARFSVKVPKLVWWRNPGLAGDPDDASSPIVGSYDEPWERRTARITVVEWGDKVEAKIITIHELAHHITKEQVGTSDHVDDFWRMCWGLYRRHRIPLERAIYSEFAYMAGSERVLREMGVPLNKEAEVAAALGAATRRRKWLAVQIRRLKARLEMTRKEREEQSIKRQVRVLKAKHRVEAKVVEKKMRAYKRSVMKRK